MTKTYDAIIIGTGQAGPFLAQRLVGAGMKVAILGAAILGTGGDEAIHSILDVMYARAPYIRSFNGRYTFTRPFRNSSPQCWANSSRFLT